MTRPKTDHRKHPRLKCRIIVENLGPTLDISAGGLRVLTANPARTGAEVRLVFQMPEAEEILQCHGRVAHVTPSDIDPELAEIGLQFQRLMTRHREALQIYVNDRIDRPVRI